MKVKEETYLETFTKSWDRFDIARKKVNPNNHPWNKWLMFQLNVELDQLRTKEKERN